MSYQLRKEDNLTLFCDREEHKGVKRVASYVAADIERVFGRRPLLTEEIFDAEQRYIVFATIGCGALYEELSTIVDVDSIKGKRECYLLTAIDNSDSKFDKSLCIVGSDKRGTIYGLFELSRLMGVSPFVNWCDVMPKERETVVIEDADLKASKEPSVRFRGFFINDEWPAFGTWVNERYGGFNATAYEHIFELLLRLKGNYMWPAMWTSRLSEDGPGLLTAELADEMGVVLGMSHHEPCLRHGEEYKYLRGKDSIYGDAWDFSNNREGITRFWEDGLKRNGKFENVITIGMRGEADSTILGHEATLKDNIDLLRDVLKTQNRLIRENVCEDLDNVPRMLALYKEVEPFFYGDATTEGLIDSPELEGVTLMLCDDNHGNLRTLPTEHMREHRGGYGMYYHYDYHGSPISYEWVNSSYLHKTWEEMTQAYEFGIRDLWIVNVGDVFTTEYPLSYFLDLAYDYDKWGLSNLDSPYEYTKNWVECNFNNGMTNEQKAEVEQLLLGYTKIAHNRRPEHMSDNVYAPMAHGERAMLYEECTDLMNRAEKLYSKCDKKCAYPFYEFVYYPLMANLNVQKLWLDTAYNHYLSKIGAAEANSVAKLVDEELERDVEIVEELHSTHDRMWYGMGLSEHIGFRQWNEEECVFPIVHTFKPSNKNRLVAVIASSGEYSEGNVWSGKHLKINDFLNPGVDEAEIILYATSDRPAEYGIDVKNDWISVSETHGEVAGSSHKSIIVKVDRTKFDGTVTGTLHFSGEYMDMDITVLARNDDGVNPNTYLWCNDYISIEAVDFSRKYDGSMESKFVVMDGFGRTKGGIKALPLIRNYIPNEDAPIVEYDIEIPKSDTYCVDVYMAPVNPVYKDNKLEFAMGFDDNALDIYNVIEDGYVITDNNPFWSPIALDNARVKTYEYELENGVRHLRFAPKTPGFVLEKIVIYRKDSKPVPSYLGPKPTYIRRQ